MDGAENRDAVGELLRHTLEMVETFGADLSDVLTTDSRNRSDDLTVSVTRPELGRIITISFFVASMTTASVILSVRSRDVAWPSEVLAVLEIAGVVVFLAYASTHAFRYLKKPGRYRSHGLEDIGEENEQLQLMHARGSSWIAQAALSYLIESDQVSQIEERAKHLCAELADAGPRAYQLGAYRNMIEAADLVKYGHRHLIPMKSTRLLWRALDSTLSEDPSDQLSAMASGDAVQPLEFYREAWRRSESTVEDARENIADFKWNIYIVIGEIVWTAIVAVATWALSCP